MTKRFPAAEVRMMDAVLLGTPNPIDADEHAERRRIEGAFERYFSSTPQGMDEGLWLNTVNWVWIKAGRPIKISVGAHPLRQTTFAKFEAQWIRRAETGAPITMVPSSAPRRRFGALVG